ncbi:putative beta-carotene 15,15'-monooxygenase [Fragilariopsis cylindrus CCMP1102]|nr:putative beta-carotene 15,15'-monooxygenase [Fragilariopsis cylindrus CCMP1102]|eukprot:OEU11318.1 putative beta-carotene 15,15'-monooxygenase [Fragilariopsis cylindrus CCMP1102]
METATTTTKKKIDDLYDDDEDEKQRQRSITAKETWSTIALEPTNNMKRTINLLENTNNEIKVYNQKLYNEFITSIKGTYYINGLSSCQIGERLIHPFEAHGYCKSFVFNGKGQLDITCSIIETPLTKKELSVQKILNRGVMSSVEPGINNGSGIIGNIKNALSSQERDTANLTADLWPRPKTSTSSTSTSSSSTIDPVLIVCTDNGEPYALDPKTLQTKGKLVDVIPKLKPIFDPPNDESTGSSGKSNKFVAHTRYDEKLNRFIMCINTMIIPGEGKDENGKPDFKGNSKMEFLEFDDNFDLVSRRSHTTDFMVFHDWSLTENYYVVPKNPASLRWNNIAKFTFGLCIGTDVFEMNETINGKFILIPRHDSIEKVIEVPTNNFFNCFHFGPCFEQSTTTTITDNDRSNDELIINGCVFDYYTFGGEMGFNGNKQEFDPITWGSYGNERPTTSATSNTDTDSNAQPIIPPMAPPPQLDQFVIDLKDMKLKSITRIPNLIPVDMPNFNGDAKKLKYSYFLGASRPEGWFPFRQIVKLNLDTYQSWTYDAGDKQLVSEPMFIPRNNGNNENNNEDIDDDDGFIISIVHNSELKETKLMIWDTKIFEKEQPEPICEIYLHDVLFPWCVHGSYYPNYNP